MSNLSPLGNRGAPRVPTLPKGVAIADYGAYLDAQKAVDYLSDNQFPVQFVTIVGTDLRMVERVTGRLNYPRVAMAGAATGAWFGLFVGLLLSLFSPGTSMFETVLPALLIGAGFGMLFGVISFSFTGGKRDFTSTSQIVAARYSVLCAEEKAGQARQMLMRMPGGEHLSQAPVAQPPQAWPHQPPVPPPAQPTPPAQSGPQGTAPQDPSHQEPSHQEPSHQDRGRADG